PTPTPTPPPPPTPTFTPTPTPTMGPHVCVVVINGTVWRDANGNGLPETDEPGLAAVRVALVRTSDRTTVATTLTDTDGHYRFEAIEPGAYWLDLDQKPLWAQLLVLTTANEPQAVAPAPCEALVAAPIGFGPKPTAEGIIGGTLWDDRNWDGHYQADEQPWPYHPVSLLNGQGSPLQTGESDAFGLYSFRELAAGVYGVRLGANGLTTASPATQNETVWITLTAGEAAFDADLGVASAAAITGQIYQDSNGNNLHDPNETIGIASVPVTVLNLLTNDIRTATSGADGAYLVPDLAPGLDRVSVPAQLPGLTITGPTTRDGVIGAVELVGGVDFGYISPSAVWLTSFTARPVAGGIELSWSTGGEEGNESFRVWRATQADGPYHPVSELIPVQGNPAGAGYRWRDKTAPSGLTPWYRLEVLPQGRLYGPITVEGSYGRVYLNRVLHRARP
ncbi:MAG: SdrD B-like domain-containing protein, partial [Anaerolineae bacterium]|nr:SdrD B-like domain-containing protein [Anaerolineae bacterium]